MHYKTGKFAFLLGGAAVLSFAPAQAKIIGGDNTIQSASASDSARTRLMISLAEPDGGDQGNEIDIPVPPGAHLSEIVIYYDESPDRVNGLQLRYQPDLESGIFSTNFVGQLTGKVFRVPIGWNDVVTGLKTQTNAEGDLVAFQLNTLRGPRGYGSTDQMGEQSKNFGDGLLFAGLRARATKKRVYALGMLTIAADQAPKRAEYNAKVKARLAAMAAAKKAQAQSASQAASQPAAQPAKQPVRSTQNRPPEKSGFAKALEDFAKSVEQGKRDRAFDEQQAKLRKEQQARNAERRRQQEIRDARARQQAANNARIAQAANTQPAIKSSNAPSQTQPQTQPAPRLTTRAASTMDADLLRLGGNSKAIIYSRCNYLGKAIGLYDGSWSMARLKQLGFEGASISSIKLMPNKQITLSTRATKQTYSANKPCLSYPVHARPDFTDFTVADRPALAAGQTKPAGFKPRKPDQMQWTPAGVTGNNIGSAWYESNRMVDGVNYFQRGRFEISEEGSNIWHWYVHSSSRTGNIGGRGSFDKPVGTYRVLRRTASSITLRAVKMVNGRYADISSKAPHREDVIDLNAGIIKSYGLFGDEAGYLTRGKITNKSRPR